MTGGADPRRGLAEAALARLGEDRSRGGEGREDGDDYAGELARAGAWRVIRCKHGLQWIVQRRRPGKAGGRARWDGVRYFRTCAALLRFCRPLSGGDGAFLAAVEALPEHIADGRAGNAKG